MDTKYTFFVTLILSVIVQIGTGLLELITLFVRVPSKYLIIRQLLILELAVQFIEGSFYFWLLYNFNMVSNVTPKRYLDWVITTPTMLVTLIIYLIYLDHKEKGDTEKLNFKDLMIKNSKNITRVLGLNWLMLLFGYLGESNIISTYTGVFLGFIPFLIYYYIIYDNYAVLSKTGWMLFWYFFFFWSLYGIVAVLPYYIKNTFYNILDLFAKNFFGLFLSYLILTESY
jgi:hypothetical protein